jgi:ABC-type transport system substrate-binding protein
VVKQIIPVTVEATRVPFSRAHPILKDVRVRQALAYCTDRAALVQAAYPFLPDPAILAAETIVPSGHWAFPAADETGLTRYPYDPGRGQAVLEMAGWKLPANAVYRLNADGEELALLLTSTDASLRQAWGAVWEAQLAACGVRLVRLHAPAAWFFGESTGLARRDFEVAAFAWVLNTDLHLANLYSCEAIPAPANQWRGQNYAGWCNPTADAAARASWSLDPEARRAAYRTVQAELTRDLPTLPLFFRADLYAVNAALENFAPDAAEMAYTWNAAEWRLPGQDQIVIGADAEPASLAPFDESYVNTVLGALLYGRDTVQRGFATQPVLLQETPTLANGLAELRTATVRADDEVVDGEGMAATLKPGLPMRLAAGEVVTYTDGELTVPQLVVTYVFKPGLTWSDGAPVTAADYALGYRIGCDPAAASAGRLEICRQIAGVDFLDDTRYRVTWKPGYFNPAFDVPPLLRLPAHPVLSDGRRLADVPAAEWASLPEVTQQPLGVGPYRVVSWTFGQRLVLEANPYSAGGRPATPRLEMRFIPAEQAVAALLAGAVHILDLETLTPEQAAELSGAPGVRVIALPSAVWEHVDFALFEP